MRARLLLLLCLLAPPAVSAQDVTAAQAHSHVGETATVCGTVTGVHQAANSKGKPTFIDFDKPYPAEDFTVVIWDDDKPRFGDLDRYNARQACVHGIIKSYRGKPEMVLKDPGALEAK